MKWLTLFLHLLSLRKNFLDSQALAEAGHAMAARTKRYAVSLLALGLAGLFLFAGILVFVIEIGLQIDREQGLGYTGLMVSSTLLVGISFLFGIFGILWSKAGGPPPAPPPAAGGDKLKALLEEFLVSFFSQLKAKGEAPKPPSGTARE